MIEQEDKILQIIPTDGNYFIQTKYDKGRIGSFGHNYQTDRHRVVCWALIERHGTQLVVPMVAAERALVFLSRDLDWKMVREA